MSQSKKSPVLRFSAPSAAHGPPLTLDNDAAQAKCLEEVFVAMDIDCNNRVNQAEFRAYLRKNPTGWPLADVLAGQPEEVKDQIIHFWFRKLDIDSEGSFDKDELIAFFRAMKQTKYKEMLYADFLLNLFDKNYDGKLDREEYATMLRVLLGRQVPAYVLSSVAAEGLSRDDLVALLHTIHCDFSKLDTRHAGKTAGAVELVLMGVVIGAAAVAVVGAISMLRRH